MLMPPIETRLTYAQIRLDVITLHRRWGVITRFLDDKAETKPFLKKLSEVFFDRLVREDLLEAQALGIARLLDPACTSVKGVMTANTSLKRLVEQVEPLNPNLKERLETHLTEIEKVSGSAEAWRNKWAGHRDEKTMVLMRTPFETRPITLKRTEVEAALKALVLFLNEFESIYHTTEIVVNNLTEEEIRHAQDIDIPKPLDYSHYCSYELDELVEKLEKASEP